MAIRIFAGANLMKQHLSMLFPSLLHIRMDVEINYWPFSNTNLLLVWLVLLIGTISGTLRAQQDSITELSAWQSDSSEVREVLRANWQAMGRSNNYEAFGYVLDSIAKREDLLCQVPALKAEYLLNRANFELATGQYSSATATYKEGIPIYQSIGDHQKTYSFSFSLVIHSYYRREGEEALKDVLSYGELCLASYEKLSEEEQEMPMTLRYLKSLKSAMESARLWLTLPLDQRTHLRKLDVKAQRLFNEGRSIYNSQGRYDLAKERYEQSQRCYDTIFATIEPPIVWSRYFSMRRYLHMSLANAESTGAIPRNTGERRVELEKSLAQAREKSPQGSNWTEQFTCDLAEYFSGYEPLKALDLLLRDSISFSLIDCSNHLAQVYSVLGDYSSAKEIHRNLIENSPNEYTRALQTQNYALCLVDAKEFGAAEYYAELALEKLSNWLRPSHPRFAFAKQALAAAYVHQGRFKDALPLIIDAKAIMTAVAGDRVQELISMHKIHIEALLGDGQIAAAEETLAKTYRCLPNSTYLFDDANLKILAASIALAKHEYQAALDSIKTGVAALKFNDAEEPQHAYQRSLMSLLFKEAQVLKATYRSQKDLAKLQASLTRAQEAIAILQEVRQSFYWEASKRELMSAAEPLLKSTIETSLWLHELLPGEGYDWLAFSFSEQYKSILLLEAAQQGNFLAEGIIPSDIREKEKEMQLQLTALTNQRFRERERGTKVDQNTISWLTYRIKSLKISFDSLNLVIQDRYPQYHQMRNQIEVLDQGQLQTLLPAEVTLLSYVLLDRTIAVFAISRDSFGYQILRPKVDVSDLVYGLQKAVVSKSRMKNSSLKMEVDSMSNMAHQLYLELIQPLEQEGWLTEKLIIVPESALGYIPFGMLLKHPPSPEKTTGGVSYLLRDHSLSYAYSASMLLEMQQRKYQPKQKGVLAFAPSFTSDSIETPEPQALETVRSSLGELFYNQQEVEKISTIVPSEVFLNQQATKENFVENANKYSILHLATHSKANDRLGDQAYLAFTGLEGEEENEMLFNSDLYNLELNADMVVLSGCETGIGELHNAEGIISLARGFSYAGAKSIVSSLWNVNDASTEEIMVNYYTNLAAGLAKDEALRSAQLTFMDNYQGDAHPFYWAPFIVIGDTVPLQFGNGSNWNLLKGALGLFAMLMVLLWAIKRK